MVARLVRDQKAAGSNPVTSTIKKSPKYLGLFVFVKVQAIRLSMSIRGLKHEHERVGVDQRIRLSMSIRGLKRMIKTTRRRMRIRLSMSIRGLKPALQQLGICHCIRLSMSIRGLKLDAYADAEAWKYPFINVHQRSKTAIYCISILRFPIYTTIIAQSAFLCPANSLPSCVLQQEDAWKHTASP